MARRQFGVVLLRLGVSLEWCCCCEVVLYLSDDAFLGDVV